MVKSYIEWLRGKNESLQIIKKYAEDLKAANIELKHDDVIDLCDRLIKMNMEFVNKAKGE